MLKTLGKVILLTAIISTISFADKKEEKKDISSEFFIDSNIKEKKMSEHFSKLEALDADTKIRNNYIKKSNQKEIIKILQEFKYLETLLNTYEEKKILRELRLFFQDKYLVKQVDIIEIDKNLNEVLKIEDTK